MYVNNHFQVKACEGPIVISAIMLRINIYIALKNVHVLSKTDQSENEITAVFPENTMVLNFQKYQHIMG